MTKDRRGVSAPDTPPPSPREERLAEALRANLRRRKAQDRARTMPKEGEKNPDAEGT